MAASPHANPALHRSNGGQAFKWLALAAVLLLGVSGIALRSAKRPSIAHRFTKDFYSGIKAEVCLQTVHRLLLKLVSLSICDNSICSTVVA